jgi:leader peptidase (prepilin peptidase) / N-methyltransferase
MTILILTLIFALGLIIGSFLNALEYRIGTKLSITKGRSICPKCKKQIAWYDNIPVVSYLFLLGNCRQCKKQISLQYPLIEIITGISFVAVFWKITTSSSLLEMTSDISVLAESKTIIGIICLLLAASCLILIALHDAKTSYIVSPAVYVGVVAMLIYRLTSYTGEVSLSSIWSFYNPILIATAIPVLLFAGLHFFSRGKWMGAGDIELAVLIGLFAGWPGILPAYYFAFIVGSIWGLIQIYLTKKAKMKSEMPFGPFLAAGALFGFTFGQQIIDIYARIFLGA